MSEVAPLRTLTVAVAGNPNAGKTTLFNLLTGSNQTVGNYPGVTVEKKEGWVQWQDVRLRIIDLPGTYSLTAYSLDEVVARAAIVDERPDVVLNVVDAANLERNLYLSLQVAEMGRPLVLALNMHDIAVQRGIAIDVSKLAQWLGVPVVATVGRRGDGRGELLDTLVRVGQGQLAAQPLNVGYGPQVEAAIAELVAEIAADPSLAAALPPRWLAIKLLEEDTKAVERVGGTASAVVAGVVLAAAQRLVRQVAAEEGGDPASLIAEHRYGHAAGIVRGCVTVSDRGATLTDALDTILCNRGLGFFFVGLVIFLAFKVTFLLANGLRYVPWVNGWTTPVGVFAWVFDEFMPLLTSRLSPGPLKSLIDHGIIAGVGGVMGFVPLIFFMFLVLAAIEDSGYVARIAFVLDRVLRVFGLQGKSILALIVSGGIAGGCAVPGVMATRTLREEKDRLTTMLVAPFMNCGAKMPVFAMLIAAFFARWQGEMMWLLAALSWAFALAMAFCLRRTVARGEQAPFVMELPPYHLPVLRHILRSALERSIMYVRKAGTVILGVSILLWVMMYLPRLDPAPFERQRQEATAAALGALVPDGTLRDAADIEAVAALVQQVRQGLAAAERQRLLEEQPERLTLAEVAAGVREPASAPVRVAAEVLREYVAQVDRSVGEQRRTQLQHSYAGRFGQALQPVAALAGFDWRDTIALLGGLAAKEVVLGTLSMTYSMGDPHGPADRGRSNFSIVNVLRAEPGWTPLRALALLLFVMLYAPCIATLVTIGRESGSWKWAAFSAVYTTVLAWLVATLVFQVGSALGIGV
jgi:ferrous iron transport protein B